MQRDAERYNNPLTRNGKQIAYKNPRNPIGYLKLLSIHYVKTYPQEKYFYFLIRYFVRLSI